MEKFLRIILLICVLLLLQYTPPDYLPKVYEDLPMHPSHREAVINAFVYVHQTLHQANSRLAKRGGRVMAITPRHYLDFINHYVSDRVFSLLICLVVKREFRLPTVIRCQPLV